MPLNIIKSVAYVWWGADPKCLLQIYKALILSKIQSSSFLWQQAPKQDLKQLELIQNTSMRKILGALSSTPIHSMQAETNLQPLRFVANKEAESLIVKMLQIEHNSTIHKIQELTAETLRQGTLHPLQQLTRAYTKWTQPDIHIVKTTNCPYQPPQDLQELVVHSPWEHFSKQSLPPQTHQLIMYSSSTPS
jgi:hypothetical protein